MFLAYQQSKVTIKFNIFFWKNAVETAKIAVDSCNVLRQFLTPLPSIDFREIRGLYRILLVHEYVMLHKIIFSQLVFR
jgi:hypothetical protein